MTRPQTPVRPLYGDVDEAIVLDIETTGTGHADRIVSVCLMHVSIANQHPLSKPVFTLVNPERDIPLEASKVNRIYAEDVESSRPFHGYAQPLRKFISDRAIIGHNLEFDRRLLSAEFLRAGLDDIDSNTSLCTMLRFQEVIGQRSGSRLLDAVRYFGLPERHAHNAVDDVLMTFDLACKLSRFR